MSTSPPFPFFEMGEAGGGLNAAQTHDTENICQSTGITTRLSLKPGFGHTCALTVSRVQAIGDNMQSEITSWIFVLLVEN